MCGNTHPLETWKTYCVGGPSSQCEERWITEKQSNPVTSTFGPLDISTSTICCPSISPKPDRKLGNIDQIFSCLGRGEGWWFIELEISKVVSDVALPGFHRNPWPLGLQTRKTWPCWPSKDVSKENSSHQFCLKCSMISPPCPLVKHTLAYETFL